MKIMIIGDETKITELLKDSLSEKLDTLMSEGHEILLGDGAWESGSAVQVYLNKAKYKNVTVFVSGGKNCKKINAGKWNEKYYATNGRSLTAKKLERIFGMADEADKGIIITGDKSRTSDVLHWVAMLYLIFQGKPCTLYPSGDKESLEIHSIDELENYIGKPEELSAELIDSILSECGFSDEYKTYLVLKDSINYRDLIEIIIQAPVSLDFKISMISKFDLTKQQKYEMLMAVKDELGLGNRKKVVKRDLRDIVELNTISLSSYRDAYNMLFDAKAEKENGNMYELDTLFYLFECWYDRDVLIEKKAPAGLYVSMDEIEKYMELARKYNDGICDDESYYTIELWKFDGNKMVHKYDYYTYNDEICWFKEYREPFDENESRYYNYIYSGDKVLQDDLNLSTPYKTGDIVNIDCRPYAPPFNAMILEDYDQYDCCLPTIIFNTPYTDRWQITALKHKHFFKDADGGCYRPDLSPLFRIRKVNECELTKGDFGLLDIQRMVDGKVDRAKRLFDIFSGSTDMELWEILEVFPQPGKRQ